MIDLFNERLLTLRQAAEALPGRPDISTVWRWCLHGVGPQRRRLETIKRGGRRFTSLEALERFVADVSSDADAETAYTAHREDAIDAAEQELDREWT